MTDNLLLQILEDGTYLLGTDNITTTWNAFIEHDNVIENLIIPQTVTIIGQCAFFKCTEIKTVQLSDSIKEIRTSAFDQCSLSIASLSLPASLMFLGKYAFADNDIKYVEINSQLKNIQVDPFGYNMNLKSIKVPDDNAYFASDSQGALYNKYYDVLYQVTCGLTAYSIPLTVTHIEEKAFDRSHLTEITLPGTISTYSKHFLYQCSEIKKIHIYCSCFTSIVPFYRLTSLQEVYYYRDKLIVYHLFELCSETFKIYACSQYPTNSFGNISITSKIGICFIIPKFTCNGCISLTNQYLLSFYMIFVFSKTS